MTGESCKKPWLARSSSLEYDLHLQAIKYDEAGLAGQLPAVSMSGSVAGVEGGRQEKRMELLRLRGRRQGWP